ncbi:putative uncharacterized protein DDB_G0282133 [Bombina bombina]|uniref:putative uncharacterized protein DDB_G0282133 n=1 Tax=Bombina bombina TaxID=8345 RepID=UPI00235B0033|nr:putative uncharacterized protein DDB_G0282133 [Bombina bombina]
MANKTSIFELRSYMYDDLRSLINKDKTEFLKTLENKKETLDDLMKLLEKKLTTELKCRTEYLFLEKYLEVKRVPRGLRIKKECSFKVEDEEFKRKWREILEDASMKLMKLIKDHRGDILISLGNEINDIESKLSDYKDSLEYKNSEKRIKDNMEELKSYLLKIKMDKFERDDQDYKHFEEGNYADTYTTHRWRHNRFRNNTQHPQEKTERSTNENRNVVQQENRVKTSYNNYRSEWNGVRHNYQRNPYNETSNNRENRPFFQNVRRQYYEGNRLNSHNSQREGDKRRNNGNKNFNENWNHDRNYDRDYDWRNHNTEGSEIIRENNVPLYNRFAPLEREQDMVDNHGSQTERHTQSYANPSTATNHHFLGRGQNTYNEPVLEAKEQRLGQRKRNHSGGEENGEEAYRKPTDKRKK